jgi:hypothetical protein
VIDREVQQQRIAVSNHGLRIVGERWSPLESVGTIVMMHGGGQTRHFLGHQCQDARASRLVRRDLRRARTWRQRLVARR